MRSQTGAIPKGVLILVGLVLVLVILGGSCISINNGAVARQQTVEAKWSQIQSQYKRRADLIPQLIETVKGAAGYEESVLKEVTEARTGAMKATVPAEAMPTDQAAMQRYAEAQAKLGAAIRTTLFAVAEAYPQLKATQNYLDFQSQLEGTENRIAVARTDYIDAVRDFNTYVRKFPNSIVASMRGFQPAAQITVEESATQVPKIDFSRPPSK
ncbi:MAG: LemA family protein [Planctomycetes bacterium]|nr:LemA family protein [Planctomycetota bacterium]MBI3846051.1 LemA family protein [Planctomycetota bacterium]